jgi:hypothetical protein
VYGRRVSAPLTGTVALLLTYLTLLIYHLHCYIMDL